MKEQAIEKILAEKYNLKKDCFWFHEPSQKWIITHVGCTIIAEKENIEFSRPEYVKNEPGEIVMYGTGTMQDKEGNEKSVWTHGEVNRKNCFISYPYAIAEKRLKDRLTLMLISIYGEVYSEIEKDEFEQQQEHLRNME